jgi:HemY protein
LIRSLSFIVVVGGLVWVAVTLSDFPGVVSLEWAGWRIDTSVAVLLGVVTFISLTIALAYRFALFLRHTPSKIKTNWLNKRRNRGYQALTRGMVAVAAGDAAEARHQANRADALLDELPLTLLVSAQAAQMSGDEAAAVKYFTAMVNRPDTEFLGLRGLYNQANKNGDKAEALSLARRAYRLKPKSTWVAIDMFDLQISNGQWLDAKVTAADLQRRKLIDPGIAKRHEAVLSYQLSLEAQKSGDSESAEDHLRNSIKLAPDFIPAVVNLAAIWVDNNKAPKAIKIIKKTWATAPNSALLSSYWMACGVTNAVDKVRAIKKLTDQCPDHLESLIALAQASLEARLWGEARQFLEVVLTKDSSPPGRVCRLLAELEESENADKKLAREWLVRESQASADPMWVCNYCEIGDEQWSVTCQKCGEFDSYYWRPPHAILGIKEPTVVDDDAKELGQHTHLINTKGETVISPRES